MWNLRPLKRIGWEKKLNYCQNFSKFDKYKHTDSRSSTDTKKKIKETTPMQLMITLPE